MPVLRAGKHCLRRNLAIGAVGGMPTTSSFIDSQLNRSETGPPPVAYIVIVLSNGHSWRAGNVILLAVPSAFILW